MIIGFIQEYKAEKALQALKTLTVQIATVVRNGEQQDIAAAELVPGDVVVLDEGDTVPGYTSSSSLALFVPMFCYIRNSCAFLCQIPTKLLLKITGKQQKAREKFPSC